MQSIKIDRKNTFLVSNSRIFNNISTKKSNNDCQCFFRKIFLEKGNFKSKVFQGAKKYFMKLILFYKKIIFKYYIYIIYSLKIIYLKFLFLFIKLNNNNVYNNNYNIYI